MRIVLTCALSTEFNEARNQLGLKEFTSKKDLPRIASKGELSLVYTGIGKVNTILNLSDYLISTRPGLVIDTGTCGSLTDALKPLDILYSYKSLEYYDIEKRGKLINNIELVTPILPAYYLNKNTVATIEKSICSTTDREKLHGSGAVAVTWETSAVFALCERLSIPALSIRGVTDSCNVDTFKDFKTNGVKVCKKLYNSVKTFIISI